MERYCSTGQSPQRAVAPTKVEEEEEGTVPASLQWVVFELWGRARGLQCPIVKINKLGNVNRDFFMFSEMSTSETIN